MIDVILELKMAMTPLENVGMLFYVVSPNRTSFQTIDEVPDYTLKVVPYFVTLIVAEQFYLLLSKRRTGRLYDIFMSLSQGALEQVVNVVFHGWRLLLYAYIYENWRIITLPWNSHWTWWISFFTVDFLYYWGHRACHEVNILWAAHQVHHSSEDYNLSTSLRQSAIQYYLQSVFYLPLALAIPPSAVLVHLYFNLIFQFWIHTEAIKTIGPLEYIFNSASHHRVHHGRNRYCIDKNYAGVLIIWDRLFGTFQVEKAPVVYGLTHNINSFSLFQIQLCHFKHIWNTFWEMKGWNNKLSVLLKGPGWSPGKPRLGNLEDIPEIEYPVKKYDPKLNLGQLTYVTPHALLLTFILSSMDVLREELPVLGFYILTAFYIISITSLSDFMERKDCSNTELLRFMMFFALESIYLNHSKTTVFFPFILTIFRLFYLVSALLWTQKIFGKVKKNISPLTKKTK